MYPDDKTLTLKGSTYVGTAQYDSIALSVSAINPNSAVTLKRADGTSVSLTHDDNTYPYHTSGSIPLASGVNKFTVTITSENGKISAQYAVEITREAQLGSDVIEDGSGGSGVTEAVTVGEKDFSNLQTAINDAGNAPDTSSGVTLKKAETIKIDVTPEPDGSLNDDAIKMILEEIQKLSEQISGLKEMLEKAAITVDKGGNIVANRDTLWEHMAEEDKAEFAPSSSDLVALPAFTAEVDKSDAEDEFYTAAITYKSAFGKFIGAEAGDMDVFKLEDDGETVHHFRPAASLKEIQGGQFIITDGAGNKIQSSAKLAGNELLIIAIKDNSKLDWDKERGKITDPPSITGKTRNDNHGSFGSGDGAGAGGGGCDAGCDTGAALIFAAALALGLLKKRR
jgi:hypothetical protein